MSVPIPQFRPPPLPEPTPVVRVVEREDVQWNRPIFKAPPFEVYQKKLFGPGGALENFRPLDAAAE